MLGALDWLIQTLGTGPAAALLVLGGVASAILPLWTYRARGAWPAVRARVVDIAARRTLMSNTWTVFVAYTPLGQQDEVSARVQVNIVKQPLRPGDGITVRHGLTSPERAIVSRWDGASTPLMIAPLFLLGAIVILNPVG
ncbi:MAG: DUF3592 domain-containing protein [Pseudomonadota bacterium]